MINLRELELMTFPEASLRRNKERSYVYHQYLKYRQKFLEGSIAAVGIGKKPVYVITREGMEHLMNQTEEEANKGLWLVRRHKDRTYITFDQRVDSENKAKSIIVDLISEESEVPISEVVFEIIQTNPIRAKVTLQNNVIYTYEKMKK